MGFFVDKGESSLAAAAAEHLGGRRTLGSEVRSDADLAKAVEDGLPTECLQALGRHGVSDHEIHVLIINPRTLSHRRHKAQRLTTEESDRAARVAWLVALTERTFGNPEKARAWLHGELGILDDRRPIDMIRTHAGARIVENVLARIAWGAPV